jgi:Family of unknown function (DUF6510)
MGRAHQPVARQLGWLGSPDHETESAGRSWFGEPHAADRDPRLAGPPDCDQVLLRLARGPGRAWLDLRGLTYLQLPTAQET